MITVGSVVDVQPWGKRGMVIDIRRRKQITVKTYNSTIFGFIDDPAITPVSPLLSSLWKMENPKISTTN